MQLRHSHVILDTCCILNFCASGYFLDILKSIPAIMTVAEVVNTQELLTFRRVEGDDNNDSSDDKTNQGSSHFEQAVAQKLLTVVDFESETEAETFLNYAAEMKDDGESATGAIAFHRNWAIATDDKKATKFLKQAAPQLQIVTTPEVIQHWSMIANLSASELRIVVKTIRKRGKYMPPKAHPLLKWWQDAMSDL